MQTKNTIPNKTFLQNRWRKPVNDKTVKVHALTHKRPLFMYVISMNIYFSRVKFQRAVVSHKTMQYILKNDEIKFILHKDHNNLRNILKSDIFTLKNETFSI